MLGRRRHVAVVMLQEALIFLKSRCFACGLVRSVLRMFHQVSSHSCISLAGRPLSCGKRCRRHKSWKYSFIIKQVLRHQMTISDVSRDQIEMKNLKGRRVHIPSFYSLTIDCNAPITSPEHHKLQYRSKLNFPEFLHRIRKQTSNSI